MSNPDIQHINDYLEEAAELLRKAAASIERDECLPKDRREIRLMVASRFAELGAIQRGLVSHDAVRQLLDRVTNA